MRKKSRFLSLRGLRKQTVAISQSNAAFLRILRRMGSFFRRIATSLRSSQ